LRENEGSRLGKKLPHVEVNGGDFVAKGNELTGRTENKTSGILSDSRKNLL